MRRKLAIGLAGLMLAGAVGPGLAQPAEGPVAPRTQARGPMVAQMGMGGVMPETPPGVREHGTKQAGGFEVTLLSSPPLSPEEMQRTMPGMGGMQGMMRGMEGMGGPPTHWVGVVVRDAAGRIVKGLSITLTVLDRTVRLMPMPGSYGAHISLLQKGSYTVTVTIARRVVPLTLAFDFEYE